jgi:hypothetical protein
MPRRLYEFLCTDGHTTEQYVDSEVRTGSCRECAKEATRVVSTGTIKLEPFSGAFPGAYDRWDRLRASKLAQERKKASQEGT